MTIAEVWPQTRVASETPRLVSWKELAKWWVQWEGEREGHDEHVTSAVPGLERRAELNGSQGQLSVGCLNSSSVVVTHRTQNWRSKSFKMREKHGKTDNHGSLYHKIKTLVWHSFFFAFKWSTGFFPYHLQHVMGSMYAEIGGNPIGVISTTLQMLGSKKRVTDAMAIAALWSHPLIWWQDVSISNWGSHVLFEWCMNGICKVVHTCPTRSTRVFWRKGFCLAARQLYIGSHFDDLFLQ